VCRDRRVRGEIHVEQDEDICGSGEFEAASEETRCIPLARATGTESRADNGRRSLVVPVFA
jgi:hypothetical protein